MLCKEPLARTVLVVVGCSLLVFSMSGCIAHRYRATTSGREAACRGLYFYTYGDVRSFLDSIEYPSDSYCLFRYGKDAAGEALRFYMKDRSNEKAFVLVVASNGDTKTVSVPSTRAYLNSDDECVAWVSDGVLHFRSGKSVALASSGIFRLSIDNAGRYCCFVYEDPDKVGPSCRSTEIVAVDNPDETLVRLDDFATAIFTNEKNLFVFCTDFARRKPSGGTFTRGINCYTFARTPAGFELEKAEYIVVPLPKHLGLSVKDMDVDNGRVFLQNRFDFPQRFLSPRFVYDLHSRILVRAGRGGERGLFLKRDILRAGR